MECGGLPPLFCRLQNFLAISPSREFPHPIAVRKNNREQR
jgi:hypothetical protein